MLKRGKITLKVLMPNWLEGKSSKVDDEAA